MALNPASIKNSKFLASIFTQGVFPVQPDIPIDLPLNFANVRNVRQHVGTYTPNNDYLAIENAVSIADAFNFMIVICDKQLSLTWQNNNGALQVPVQRFGFFSWFENDPGYHVFGLFIDGRTAPNPANLPMPQGVAVNYQIIVGFADIN